MGATVAAARDALWSPEAPPELVEALLSVEPLALDWKLALAARLPD